MPRVSALKNLVRLSSRELLLYIIRSDSIKVHPHDIKRYVSKFVTMCYLFIYKHVMTVVQRLSVRRDIRESLNKKDDRTYI